MWALDSAMLSIAMYLPACPRASHAIPRCLCYSTCRYTLTAESRSRSTLLIMHHVEWDPSMNFMLKPMVSKGVDGEQW